MSDELDLKYWNNLYLNKDSPWDVGEISQPLREYFSQLKNKNISVLIPGAGNAYEAEYLVNAGFENVYVCDFAEEPLKNLSDRCPKIKKENLLYIDFFEINSPVTPSLPAPSIVEASKDSREPFAFDLIIEQTFFCALRPSLRKKYFEKMHSLLEPGGKLVGLLFNDFINADKPPFGGSKEEYKMYFESLFKINVYETCHNSIKPRAGRELFINLEKQT